MFQSVMKSMEIGEKHALLEDPAHPSVQLRGFHGFLLLPYRTLYCHTIEIMLFGLLTRLLLFWTLTDLTLGAFKLNGDAFYFPDQTDYIKRSAMCEDNLILWPGNRRCYPEGEQGPCNIGRILRFDSRYLKPYCSDA